MTISLSDFADVWDQVGTLIRKEISGGGNVPDEKYSPAFITAITQLLLDEGGHGNDPDDPGGETNFGLDKRTYPDLDLKNITRDEAIAIYYKDWWLKYRLDLFPDALGGKMLNVGVNTGMSQAAKFLQRAVGVSDDGIIGPLTRAAVGKADVTATLQSIRSQQRAFYINLANARPVLQKFLKGWLRRAAE